MALKIVVQALKRGLKEPTYFPIEYLYKVWKNSEGQVINKTLETFVFNDLYIILLNFYFTKLSWIIHSIKHPDIFCIADYPCRRTSTECLKAQPEDDNKLIASWRSLNLLEVLLNLSENGIYANCVELFKFPITHCPDLLLLGLLQLTVNNTEFNLIVCSKFFYKFY